MKLRYDNTVTLGTILQLVVLLCGLAAAWFDLRTRVVGHDLQINQIMVIIASIEKTQSNLASNQADITKNLSVLTAIVNERTHSIGVHQ